MILQMERLPLIHNKGMPYFILVPIPIPILTLQQILQIRTTKRQQERNTTRRNQKKLAQWSVLVEIVRKYFAQKTNF